MSTPILEVSNLETYYGPIMAIRGVSLQVLPGQVVAVLGANGAGKTTLLKTISGILDPRKGSVLFEGKPIHANDPDLIVRNGLSQVPEGREVFPFLSVRDNLKLGAFIRRDADGIRQDIERQLDYFPRLRQREKTAAGLMSGGEQQMLAIARALMACPKLLLLDEPSLGLSPALVKEIFIIIKRIRSEQNIAILVVEQNAAMALSVADYGYIMENGRVVTDGAASVLLEKDDVKQSYLGLHGEGIRGERRWKQRKTWR
ncbi:MAG: ABC transporter ATP-binding protein [Pseudomonadota bacterium]